jgi:hypothetical protein
MKGEIMAELVFATESRGSVAPVEGREGMLRATSSGTDPSGEAVSFESEVVLTGATFKENGSIQFGERGKVRFETLGDGHLEASPQPELQWGMVRWRVTGGDGEFQGASGFITSNFTVSSNGELVDNQYARIFTS